MIRWRDQNKSDSAMEAEQEVKERQGLECEAWNSLNNGWPSDNTNRGDADLYERWA